MEVKRSTHEPRFCKTCNNYKPPRTHHCSTCGRCVLKMDHHCPWINSCVGFYNYGHFIRFITYIEISAIYLFILLGCRLAQVIHEMNEVREMADDDKRLAHSMCYVVQCTSFHHRSGISCNQSHSFFCCHCHCRHFERIPCLLSHYQYHYH